MKTKAKNAIKEFFYQSFRRHSKDEYAEIFTRGFNTEGENTVYPWLHLRVFAVLAVIYTLYAVINSTLPGAGDWETFYFVGAAFMDIGFLVLLFELYPRRDISLLMLLGVMVIGGTFSDLIVSLIYYFHSYETISNGWKLAAIAGVGEEISKAIPSFICIVLLKKKNNPAAGFLIGAAVGTWFSLTENASYIHAAHPMGMMVLTATARAFGCAFSHAAWTALISRAFCKFKKPFINFRFYGVVLLCMALHFCIDMPLYDYLVILFAEGAVCGIAALIFLTAVIYKERKSALADFPREEVCHPLSAEHKLNITSAGFGIVLCALLLVLAALFSSTTTVYTEYTVDEFMLFAHDGYSFVIDEDRPFDENAEKNYFEQHEQGKLTVARQLVELDGIKYVYCYRLTEPEAEETEEVTVQNEEAKETFELSNVYVILGNDGEEVIYYRITYLTDGGSISYFPINEELSKGTLKIDGDKVLFLKRVDKLNARSISLICVSSAVAAGWGLTYLLLKRKYNK